MKFIFIIISVKRHRLLAGHSAPQRLAKISLIVNNLISFTILNKTMIVKLLSKYEINYHLHHLCIVSVGLIPNSLNSLTNVA